MATVEKIGSAIRFDNVLSIEFMRLGVSIDGGSLTAPIDQLNYNDNHIVWRRITETILIYIPYEVGKQAANLIDEAKRE